MIHHLEIYFLSPECVSIHSKETFQYSQKKRKRNNLIRPHNMTSSSGNFELEGVYSTTQFAGGCAHSIRQLKNLKKNLPTQVSKSNAQREKFSHK